MFKKGSILEVEIDSIKFPNIGMCSVADRRVAVKGGLPDQKLTIQMMRKGKMPKAHILEVITPSPHEITPKCPIFGLCGGCAFQNIPYEYEIKLKTTMVKKILEPLDLEDAFLPTIPAVAQDGYRNKMEFSFGDDGMDGSLTLGMRKKGAFYEAINAECCLLTHPDFGSILAFTLDYFKNIGENFYHRRREVGALRHLVIRRGIRGGDILVNLVTAGKNEYGDYATRLLDIPLDGKIIGIINTVNNSPADAVIAEEVKILYGADYYHEDIHGLHFKVSAFSFFQTNSIMAEVLYQTIADFAGGLRGKTIFDLYCGTGTIGIFLSKYAKKVVGIEIVEEAVAAAKENAALNNATNCEFIAGDVRKMVKTLKHAPDIVVLDPPREGIIPKAIPDILTFGANRIIYVSCKPTSLANDLPHFMAAGYAVDKIRLIDMFPRTANVEAVCCLSRM